MKNGANAPSTSGSRLRSDIPEGIIGGMLFLDIKMAEFFWLDKAAGFRIFDFFRPLPDFVW